MSLKIRLKKKINLNKNTFEIVVIEEKKKRDGKHLELLGTYNQYNKYLYINLNRLKYWISNGVILNNSVIKLLLRFKLI